MTLSVWKERGTTLDAQRFTWKEIVQPPISKLDDDAFTRVRIILMNGIENEALRFSHAFARKTPQREIALLLARVRRMHQHQATLVNWLLPADQGPLETTIGYEQVAIEVTASLAQNEPDPYLAQMFRFGLLEDFDHMYRYGALMDRLLGKDANTILQGYTDILPGRPTMVEHRHPEDDLRFHYDRTRAEPITKLNAMTLVAGEQQTHNYYMNIGPTFADPNARLLYAEIASIEEQHVTQYESLVDPNETWLEKWLMHQACEVYNYYGCVESETNARIRAIWQRCLDYELGQLHAVAEIFERLEKRDRRELVPDVLPKTIAYESQRRFVLETLRLERDLRAVGTEVVDVDEEIARDPPSISYRHHINSQGSPSEDVARGYRWQPGGELAPSTDVVEDTQTRINP